MVEFNARKENNPKYSLRSFAKDVGVRSGRLSEILRGSRALTPKLGQQLAERLGYDERKKEKIESMIRSARSRRKSGPSAERVEPPEGSSPCLLSADKFALIADWQHIAIRNLLETSDCPADPAGIAGRLGLSLFEAEDAIDRLLRLGLLERKGNRLRRTPHFITTEDVPSRALRRSHKQTLEQVIVALENVPVHLREITSVTLPTSPEKLSRAKEAIRKFRNEMIALLEEGEKTEVYNLNIQLVPVSKVRSHI